MGPSASATATACNMSTPTIEQIVASLSESEAFRYFVHYVYTLRDQSIAELSNADGPNEVMKLAGSISMLDFLYSQLTTETSA